MFLAPNRGKKVIMIFAVVSQSHCFCISGLFVAKASLFFYVIFFFLGNLEAWSGSEAIGETKAGIEVHMDGEEHRHSSRPNNSWAWLNPFKSILLLAQKRCLGRAQGSTREQALDIPETDDHSSQSGHRHHQLVAAKWRQFGLNYNTLYKHLLFSYLVYHRVVELAL